MQEKTLINLFYYNGLCWLLSFMANYILRSYPNLQTNPIVVVGSWLLMMGTFIFFIICCSKRSKYLKNIK